MYIAIDIGGTKTLIATFSDHGKLLESIKFKTPRSYQDFPGLIRASINKLGASSIEDCAVGCRGQIDRANGILVSGGSALPWTNAPLSNDISSITSSPVIIENDANLAGLSEAILVHDSFSSALYVTISTGIGSGYIINGSIDQNTINAEIGHMIFKRGAGYVTWEEIASGKTIVDIYGKQASEIDDYHTWHKITENIAIGLVNIALTLTPSVIIIGGGAGGNFSKFEKPLQEWLKKLYPKTSNSMPPVIGASRPEEAVIYGCYELIKQR